MRSASWIATMTYGVAGRFALADVLHVELLALLSVSFTSAFADVLRDEGLYARKDGNGFDAWSHRLHRLDWRSCSAISAQGCRPNARAAIGNVSAMYSKVCLWLRLLGGAGELGEKVLHLRLLLL